MGDDRSGGSGGRGGLSLGRDALGDHLTRDHTLATAAATDAAAFDDRLTTAAATNATAFDDRLATAAAAIAGSGTGLARGSSRFAVALVAVPAEQAVATLPLAVATVMTGEQATVAAAMAAVTGDGTRVTANQGDGHEREEHRKSKTKKTLHH